jgi:hypothetical protein
MNILTSILYNMQRAAIARPALPVTHKFGHGLRVTIVYYQATRQFSLVLARMGVYPSSQEWETICKQWSYPVHAQAHTGERDGLYYLAGMIPGQPRTQ